METPDTNNVAGISTVTELPGLFYRISPYEPDDNGSAGDGIMTQPNGDDSRGRRLAKSVDPIYDTIFNNPDLRGSLGLAKNDDDEEAENSPTFTLLNSFWFMIASLLQQGTDLLPRYSTLL